MKTYAVEIDRTESGRFALTVPALPGLLILGESADEVLERARAAIEFRARDLQGWPGRPEEVALAPHSSGVLQEVGCKPGLD